MIIIGAILRPFFVRRNKQRAEDKKKKEEGNVEFTVGEPESGETSESESGETSESESDETVPDPEIPAK